MEDLMQKRLKENQGKKVRVVLKTNNFIYFGKIINSDEKYLEILDERTQTYKIISISEIKDLEVKG